MINSIIEQQVQNAAQELLDDKTIKILKGVRRIASKQGGENAIENYQLLGKRTLIALGITIVAVQAVSSAVGFVVSRKSEEQRIERIVRRVLEEERQKAIQELAPDPEITRFKGLGEISPEEFAGFIGPDMRLEQVTLHKNDQVQKLLEYYMGKNTMERQNFIIDNLVIEEDKPEDYDYE